MASSKTPHPAPRKISLKTESIPQPITEDSDMEDKVPQEILANMTPEEKDQLFRRVYPFMGWLMGGEASLWYKPLLFSERDRIACAELSAILFHCILSDKDGNTSGLASKGRANKSPGATSNESSAGQGSSFLSHHMMSFVSREACLNKLDQLQVALAQDRSLSITIQGLCNIFATALKMASVADAIEIDELFVDDPNFNLKKRVTEIIQEFHAAKKALDTQNEALKKGREARNTCNDYLHDVFDKMAQEFSPTLPKGVKTKIIKKFWDEANSSEIAKNRPGDPYGKIERKAFLEAYYTYIENKGK